MKLWLWSMSEKCCKFSCCFFLFIIFLMFIQWFVLFNIYYCTNRCKHIYIYIYIYSTKLYDKCSYMFRCLCTIFRDKSEFVLHWHNITIILHEVQKGTCQFSPKITHCIYNLVNYMIPTDLTTIFQLFYTINIYDIYWSVVSDFISVKTFAIVNLHM
jgi:hypothetical protein